MEGGDNLNYAALHLTGLKASRGRKKKELKTEESVYSQVRCWMWKCVHEIMWIVVLQYWLIDGVNK